MHRNVILISVPKFDGVRMKISPIQNPPDSHLHNNNNCFLKQIEL